MQSTLCTFGALIAGPHSRRSSPDYADRFLYSVWRQHSWVQIAVFDKRVSLDHRNHWGVEDETDNSVQWRLASRTSLFVCIGWVYKVIHLLLTISLSPQQPSTFRKNHHARALYHNPCYKLRRASGTFSSYSSQSQTLSTVLDHSGSFSRNHLQKTSNFLPASWSPNSCRSEVMNWSKVVIFSSPISVILKLKALSWG